MKCYVSIFLTVVLFVASINFSVFAEQSNSKIINAAKAQIYLIRAGGGDGGSGSGDSGGGGTSGDSGTSDGTKGRGSVLNSILSIIFFVFISSGTAIIFRFKLSKYACNTKKLINLLQKENSAWKYKNVEKQVYDTYFIVQNAWTSLDIQSAQNYMSEELYDSFKTKLSWMEYRKQRNVLENIKLLKVLPVSIYHKEDDSLDYVWFYIRGRMVDYTIDTQTNLKISGNTSSESFSEYWQFVHKTNGRWVLNKILQKDETQQIIFTE